MNHLELLLLVLCAIIHFVTEYRKSVELAKKEKKEEEEITRDSEAILDALACIASGKNKCTSCAKFAKLVNTNHSKNLQLEIIKNQLRNVRK